MLVLDVLPVLTDPDGLYIAIQRLAAGVRDWCAFIANEEEHKKQKVELARGLYEEGRHEEALSYLRDLALANVVPRRDLMMASVNVLAELDQRAAHSVLSEVVENNRRDPVLNYRLGHLSRRMDIFFAHDAAYFLRRACELHPQPPVMWLWELGAAQLEVEDRSGAMRTALRLEAMNPDDPLAHTIQANEDFTIGEFEAAAAQLSSADAALVLVLGEERAYLEFELDAIRKRMKPWFERRNVGDQLLFDDLISRAQLEVARGEVERTGEPISAVIQRLGFVDEGDLIASTARRFEVPSLELLKFDVEKDVLNLVPAEVARRYGILPIDKFGDSLIVATSQPDCDVIAGLHLLTGLNIFSVIASQRALLEELDRYYGPANVSSPN